VYTPAGIFDKTQIIVADHNKEAMRAEKEKREPCLIPKISAHILRHTFCTLMCEIETNTKIIQEFMGHKISVLR
jgi:integrase